LTSIDERHEQQVGQAYQHNERNENHHRDDAANKFDQKNHKLAWFTSNGTEMSHGRMRWQTP